MVSEFRLNACGKCTGFFTKLLKSEMGSEGKRLFVAGRTGRCAVVLRMRRPERGCATIFTGPAVHDWWHMRRSPHTNDGSAGPDALGRIASDRIALEPAN
jgi:hypothetical protein